MDTQNAIPAINLAILSQFVLTLRPNISTAQEGRSSKKTQVKSKDMINALNII